MRTVPAIMAVLVIAAMFVPVLAENRYYDNNPALREVLPTDAYGYVVFYARGVTVQDTLIFIDRQESNMTFDRSYHPDHSVIDDQNAGMLQVKLLPDGVSEPVMLSAGNYTAFMRQGNSDQPEQYDFKIGGGATERVVFLGAAIPTKHRPKCVNFTVLNNDEWWEHFGDYNEADEYVGMGNGDYIREYTGIDPYYYEYVEPLFHPAGTHEEWLDEVNHTVYHPEVNHTVTIIDEPAWDEEIYHPEVNHTACYDEVNHTVHHYAQARLANWNWCIGDWESGHVHARINGNPSQIDFEYNGNVYHITGNKHDTAFIITSQAYDEIVVDVPAYCEIIVDQEAWTEIIHHDAITHEEIVVDEEAWEEIVVDVEGHWVTIIDTEEWWEHFGSYDEFHNYVGLGNGDYNRYETPGYQEYILVYIEPLFHPSGTHFEVVCSDYGEPASPSHVVTASTTQSFLASGFL